MSHSQKKQMLVISLQNTESEPNILIEFEDHYLYEHRMHLTFTALETFDNDRLLNDCNFCNKLGWTVLLSLLSGKEFCDQHNYKYECLVAYQFEWAGKPVFRFDEETYHFKPHRTYCTSIPLPSLDLEDVCAVKGFQEKVGQTLIAHLPLNEGEKIENMLRLETEHRPKMFESQ